MSGLLALLDDVAALARLAAAQVDDVAGMAAKAGTKVAGVVIDDTAVTPKYVHGLPAARELPIVYQIARGSIFNKLVILLPAAMLLNIFAPFLLTPLLMLGGAYLCFEGAEKIVHHFFPSETHHEEEEIHDPEHLERTRVAGAIKTDFVLSAEIMTITLAAIEAENVWIEGAVLAVVAIGITFVVYGSVALLVKADDVGLRMSVSGRLEATRRLGRFIVKAMPGFMTGLATVGTVAMLWVGGSIIVHGLKDFGITAPWDLIHDAAVWAGHALPSIAGFAEWAVTAGLDGILGLLLGFVLVPLVTRIILPMAERLTPSKAGES